MLIQSNKKFRIKLLALILTCSAGIVLGNNLHMNDKADKSKNIDEINFQNVKIQRSDTDGYEFVGRIINKSIKHTVRSVDINIKFYDCPNRSNENDCVVIGERVESIYLTIPPKKEKGFKVPIFIYADLLNFKGDLEWRYNILTVISD